MTDDLRRERAEAQQDFEDTLDDLKSTGARLRAVQRDYAATQAALAASQQDLTLVEGEAEQQRAHKEAHLRQRDDAWVALDLARAELASARQELESLHENARISAEVIRERNAWRRGVWQALGIDMLAPPPDAAETILSLRAELSSAIQDRDYLRALLDESLEHRAILRSQLDQAAASRVDVARNNRLGDCGFCGVQIMRGHAVEPMPEAGGLRHTACPDSCHLCEQLIQPGDAFEELPRSGGIVQHTNPCTDKEN